MFIEIVENGMFAVLYTDFKSNYFECTHTLSLYVDYKFFIILKATDKDKHQTTETK